MPGTLKAQIADIGRSAARPPGLARLVSPFGVISRVQAGSPPRGLAGLALSYALAGRPGGGSHPGIAGYGMARDGGTARTIALAEAAERYAGQDWRVRDAADPGQVAGRSPDGWPRARAADLPGPVLDLARLPRCTDAEYAAPGCPVVPFDADAEIRWARGIDLASGKPTWLPAIMACYGLADPTPADRFWHSISTGYAVHTDPRIALCSAICEVIERDIIEVLWRQRLALPPVADRHLTGECRRILGWFDDHFMSALLFDATSDLGVPTAYCLSIAEHDLVRRQTVSCATGATLAAAAEKVARDAAMQRAPAPRDEPVKDDFRDFTSLEDGMRYMARPERAPAFDFLVADREDRPSPDRRGLAADPGQRLRELVDALDAAGMQAVAVDRTSPELADAGLTAFCVVIPDLQPMTTRPLVSYLAHPRLYSAPARMGYPVLPEEGLNPWPQPFA